MKVFMDYAKAVGLVLSVIICLLYGCQNAAAIGANVWLSDWTKDASANQTRDEVNMRLGVYASLGIAQGEIRSGDSPWRLWLETSWRLWLETPRETLIGDSGWSLPGESGWSLSLETFPGDLLKTELSTELTLFLSRFTQNHYWFIPCSSSRVFCV